MQTIEDLNPKKKKGKFNERKLCPGAEDKTRWKKLNNSTMAFAIYHGFVGVGSFTERPDKIFVFLFDVIYIYTQLINKN